MNIRQRQAQDKFSRYSRMVLRSKFPNAEMMVLVIRHFPPSLRSWASDQLTLKVAEFQIGAK